jgi:hypothetical protein
MVVTKLERRPWSITEQEKGRNGETEPPEADREED